MGADRHADQVPEHVDDADLARDLTRFRRRRWLLAGGIVGLALVAVGVVALWQALRPTPACHGQRVAAFLASPSIPVGVLHEVCALPAPLSNALRALEGASPDHAPLLVARYASEDAPLLARVCPRFVRALADVAAAPPAEKTGVFLAACHPSALGFADEAALRAAPLERVLLALALRAALVDSDPAAADTLPRAVLTRRW